MKIEQRYKELAQNILRFSLLSFLAVFFFSTDQVFAKDVIYKYTSPEGVVSFSDKPPTDIQYQQIKVGCYACRLDSLINWRKTKLYPEKFKTIILTESIKAGVDPALVQAIIHAESHFDRNALSKQGAQGLMQLMPETGKYLGVVDAFKADQNIKGGIAHFSRLMKKYGGDISLATAAYNAGESNIAKYGAIPPFEETQTYVKRVAILHQRYASLNRSM